ncbi:MAG: LysR family transcriptional regulator [Veillonellales bacterium]
MNLHSLYYFNELAKDLNMTRTAERLFISQQTLSNHILRLEEYYGIKLFTRNHKMSLTDAGVYLRDFTANLLQQDKRIRDIFFDLKIQERGFLRFGASSLRASNCLPKLLPHFSEKFPNVEIELINENSDALQKKIIQGELDLALCVLNDEPPTLQTELLLQDQIYLCISEKLLDKYYYKNKEELKQKSLSGVHLENFSELPYFVMSIANRLGTVISKCFEEAGYSPKVYLRAKYVALSAMVCSNALAACFMTQMDLISSLSNIAEDVNIFPLLYKNEPLYHNLYLVRHKKCYFPKYVQYFSSLLHDYFQSASAIDMSHIYLEHPDQF